MNEKLSGHMSEPLPEQQDVWLLDDDASIRWVLERALQRAGFRPRSFSRAQQLRQALTEGQPAVVLTDVRMPGEDGLKVLAQLQQEHPDIPVIVMTAHSDLDSAVSAFQGGAFEYLPKPFDLNDAVQVVWRAIQQRQRNTEAAPAAEAAANMKLGAQLTSDLIGEAPAMQEVFRAIGRLSGSSVSVLLTGASGTGKELVARALHLHSPRARQPFIALNMAAIPSELVESELFGHEKGAFTGATQKRRGRFEQAHGGTLFLDEIGDMPLAVQTRLLRVLAEGQFFPVGSHEAVSVDVRIIAATHQQLEERVAAGDFRDDLFHRLNVIRLQLPTLAERKEDIPKLVQHFLQAAAKELGGEPKHLTAEAMRKLQHAPWPGNVRQLENTCRWLTVMAPGQRVDVGDLPADVLQSYSLPKVAGLPMTSDSPTAAHHDPDNWLDGFGAWLDQQLAADKEAILDEAVKLIERRALEQTLTFSQGHKQEAARRLGWGRNTITRKLAEFAVADQSSGSKPEEPR